MIFARICCEEEEEQLQLALKAASKPYIYRRLLIRDLEKIKYPNSYTSFHLAIEACGYVNRLPPVVLQCELRNRDKVGRKSTSNKLLSHI